MSWFEAIALAARDHMVEHWMDHTRQIYRKGQKRLAKAQRQLAKALRTHPKRREYRKRVAACHRKVRNQRADFLHKLSKRLVQTYSLIAIEKLNVKGLASGMLAKSVNDAAWSIFTAQLRYKAESAGSQLVEVDPRFTSQTCPQCGSTVRRNFRNVGTLVWIVVLSVIVMLLPLS